MSKKISLSKNIEQFYNKASEETRLEKGMGIYEFERLQSLIARYTSTQPLTILDIGGGTGKYSAWLAEKGHNVYMIEPVAKHLAIAQNRAKTLKKKFYIQQGLAQRLPFPNHFADLVILHGPLYHLQDKEDRLQAIAEAKRVLKNNGIALGIAISYTASTLVGLLHGLIHKKAFFNMCSEELMTGEHNPPEDFPWLLAEAYYHKPQELKDEFISQNFAHLDTYAVEGIAWLDKDYFASMLDQKKRSTLMKLIELTENDHDLLPFSPHIMIAVQKREKNGR